MSTNHSVINKHVVRWKPTPNQRLPPLTTTAVRLRLLSRGMEPFHRDKLKGNLRSVLNMPKMPKVPAQFGHVISNEIPWEMDAKTQAGCCVTAGGETRDDLADGQ